MLTRQALAHKETERVSQDARGHAHDVTGQAATPGTPVFGMFYMPLLDDLTYTAADDDERILSHSVRSKWGIKDFLAVSTDAHHDFFINVPRTRALGSSGASLVYTARGSAAAAFIPKANVWDLVAGAAILNRTGGELRYLNGQAVEYQSLLDGRLIEDPIIAGHPDLLVELQKAIRPCNKATS